jgi:antitoxin VapB
MTETTVFQSGNSQAVRLPKEFRFNSKTVEIFRRGNEVVLREKPRTMGDVLAEAFAGLPPLTEQDHADMDAMLAAIHEPLPPDTRNWDALWDDYAAPPKPEPKAPPAKVAKAARAVGGKAKSKVA